MTTSLNQLIVAALTAAKHPLQNNEVRKYVQKRRPQTTNQTIDSVLNIAAKTGLITKTPVTGLGKSKNVYSIVKPRSVAKIIRDVLTSAKKDSLEIFLIVQAERPTVSKDAIDKSLYQLSKDNLIKRSKNPMTDSNTISSQSKFLYSL